MPTSVGAQRRLSSVLCVLALSATAHADAPPRTERSFSPQLFHPAVGPDEFGTVEPAVVLPRLNFSFGAWLNYGSGGITVDTLDSNNTTVHKSSLLSQQLGLDLVFAIGVLDRLQVGVGVPLSLYQSGDSFTYGFNGSSNTLKAPAAFTVGDPWLSLKLRLVGHDRGLVVSLRAIVTLPLGELVTSDAFAGDTLPDVGLDVLAGYEGARFRAGLTAGLFYRPNTSVLFATVAGTELRYGLALAYDLWLHSVIAVVELFGRSGLSSATIQDYSSGMLAPHDVGGLGAVDGNPIELAVSAKLRLSSSTFLTLGGGTGVHGGMGSATLRGFAGVSFAPDRRDRDHDGIADVDDKCPDVPEDKDGFQDQDGCPDPDNDLDGIPDARDRCPDVAEDFDGFEDEDGCPDLDNDQDGVPDLTDKCPNEKEDGLPPAPTDGCPRDKADRDGDGIPDFKDKCPDDPEDKDGFQDDDGCPDPDNDGDGYADKDDKCPNEPEDFDQFQDEDGCPDPDNDADGIPDDQDKCPNEPETINGFQDEDGCPDKGPAPKVQIVGDDLILLDKIEFESNRSPMVAPHMGGLMGQIASTLKAHAEIKKVVIEGHVDDTGDAGRNHKLSQERADLVRSELINRGVVAGRLEAKGLGATRPVADDHTARGREANRRIELHIVERGSVHAAPTAAPRK